MKRPTHGSSDTVDERAPSGTTGNEALPDSAVLQNTRIPAPTLPERHHAGSNPSGSAPAPQYQYRVIPPTSPRSRVTLPPRVLTIEELVYRRLLPLNKAD
jgi:hypothetical protein